MAEVLGRYSRCVSGAILDKAWATAEHQRRVEPWRPKAIPGPFRWRTLSSRDLPAMVTMYEAGSTAGEVAKRFGVSESALLARLRAAGVIRPSGKVSSEQVAEMVQLRRQGLSYREIGDRYGVTRRAVSARLASAITTTPSQDASSH